MTTSYERLIWAAALLLPLCLTQASWAQDATPEPDAAAPTAEADPAEGEDTTTEEEVPADPAALIAALTDNANALWTCLAAFLVFFMQAGFMLVEAGMTRAKNACNIIMKNAMDFSLGTLTFWMIGFGLMFGTTKGYIGTDGFFYTGSTPFEWAFLIFQTVFAATAATIVSGAMAERTKFVGYLLYTLGITVIVYPIFGSWCWNGLVSDTGAGWLEGRGFLDFAGSTVVHSIGGWCALAGAIVIGPRLGKYGKDGRVNAIPGHSIPLAALGVFILWLGWFGFNPGSTTDISGAVAFIAVTTNLAAAGGALGGMLTSWVMFKKPDPSFTLNGALAGLVAITAGCDVIAPGLAALTGFIGGVLVVFSVLFFDKLKIDDPVGAVSVHGVCGAWGTLAVGLFMSKSGLFTGGGAAQLVTQFIGVAAGFLWAFPVSFVIFYLIKVTVGLRVSEQEELEGLDITEHGMHAYPPNLVADGATGSMPAMASTGAPAASSVPATGGA